MYYAIKDEYIHITLEHSEHHTGTLKLLNEGIKNTMQNMWRNKNSNPSYILYVRIFVVDINIIVVKDHCWALLKIESMTLLVHNGIYTYCEIKVHVK